ncbi:hypothetical protein HanIR_Chr10g0457081 [Helianthus annuus]|nr:hypothetical protein HanIR_Chr10g0457081 [Helianthus annuus]
MSKKNNFLQKLTTYSLSNTFSFLRRSVIHPVILIKSGICFDCTIRCLWLSCEVLCTYFLSVR